MLFNSGEYLLFFILTLALSWLVVGLPRLRTWILFLASYYFYISNNHWLILLIVVSTQIDFAAGRAIERSTNKSVRKCWLLGSLTANLGILVFFKYFNFFADSVVQLLAFAGLQASWVDLNIVLPVGISFYTFQSMSYTIDIYRGRLQAEKSWLNFAFYISFFPQLIAGPIVRATEFLPQTHRKPSLDGTTLEHALFRIFLGLGKKIVLADYLARFADPVFASNQPVDALTAWLAVYAFTFQIYFDFSGYTDIAIGSARLLGFSLPENFRRPYMSPSFSAFWRRWHLTLSFWFRDYLYIPLGGSRTTTLGGTLRNLMLTMGLCGLWHGAAWNFVLWGVLHGALLCFERIVGWGGKIERVPLWRGFLFFHCVALTWIPFRADSLASMGGLLGDMFTGGAPETITWGMVLAVVIIVCAWGTQCLAEHLDLEKLFLSKPLPLKAAAYALLWALVLVCNSQGAKQFIYFQF